MTQKIKNYVLVHGAWGSAWEFEDVTKLLSADGSNVVAPDLPGHGENPAAIEAVTMQAYVDHLIRVITNINEKVILVGHSLAGAVISQVAEHIPEKIDRLVYVAAFLPKNGDVPIELMQGDEKGELLPRIDFSQDQTYATLKEEVIVNQLLHDVADPEVVKRWIPVLSIKQATQPFMTALSLSEKAFGSVPKYFVRAKLDKVMSLGLQNEMIGNWPVEQVYTLESGHFPLTSMADQLSETIQKITA